MKTFRPQMERTLSDWSGLDGLNVVTDFRGQDYVRTRNVCSNTTYARNYEIWRG